MPKKAKKDKKPKVKKPVKPKFKKPVKPKVKKPIKPKVKTNKDVINKEIKIQNLTEIGDMAYKKLYNVAQKEGRGILKDVTGYAVDYALDYFLK